MTMASVGSAVQDGCDKVRRQAITLAVGDRQIPAARGRCRGRRRPGRAAAHSRTTRRAGETYQQLLARNQRDHLEVTAPGLGRRAKKRFSMYAYGAVFAEVAVDATPRTGTDPAHARRATTRAASSTPSSPTARPSAAWSAASAPPCWSTPSPTPRRPDREREPGRLPRPGQRRRPRPPAPSTWTAKTAKPTRSASRDSANSSASASPRHRQRRLPRHRPPRTQLPHHRRSTPVTRAPVRCTPQRPAGNQSHATCRTGPPPQPSPRRTAAAHPLPTNHQDPR